jgi:hypothetical protein
VVWASATHLFCSHGRPASAHPSVSLTQLASAISARSGVAASGCDPPELLAAHAPSSHTTTVTAPATVTLIEVVMFR